MKILVLGGTVFVGRHLVEAALKRGHDVTLFNRGKSDPNVFSDVEQLRGDRHGDLSELRHGTWDAVVDTYGYFPEVVQRLTMCLRSRTSHYTFISSICVYSSFASPPINESQATGPRLLNAKNNRITRCEYGPMKAACEGVVNEVFSDRALIIRPGLIAGPYDYTNRLPYWIHRISEGGQVLTPGDPSQPIQLIDARDLALWIVMMIEQRSTGAFNTVGPARPTSTGRLLEMCENVTNSSASLQWIPSTFLVEQGVVPFSDLPFWLPGAQAHFYDVDNRKAVAAGLNFRPLLETLRDTSAWLGKITESRHIERVLADPENISRHREQQILTAWQALSQTERERYHRTSIPASHPWPCT